MLKSVFEWSTAGLNSECSFSLTGCLAKVKELNLPDYLPITGEAIEVMFNVKNTIINTIDVLYSFVKRCLQ